MCLGGSRDSLVLWSHSSDLLCWLKVDNCTLNLTFSRKRRLLMYFCIPRCGPVLLIVWQLYMCPYMYLLWDILNDVFLLLKKHKTPLVGGTLILDFLFISIIEHIFLHVIHPWGRRKKLYFEAHLVSLSQHSSSYLVPCWRHVLMTQILFQCCDVVLYMNEQPQPICMV